MASKVQPERPVLTCPRCGSSSNLPIYYGLPTPNMFKLAKAGKARLGGCLIDDSVPTQACVECGEEWRA